MSDDAPTTKSGPGRREVDGGLPSDDVAAADLDQTASDLDQTAADLDQTASDVDQSASERDQRASDRDQAAADIDQVEADRAPGSASGASTRRARSQSTIERDVASHARVEASRVRDHVAELRDRAAQERDVAADERDRLAAALDAEMAQLEAADATAGDGPDAVLAEGLRSGCHAAAVRERAAAARAAAARDRQAARADRRRAGVDRETANAELALEGADYLTGALRRRAGLRALTRELARAHRTQEPLLVAFVDVDGLKVINDAYGHAAGDAVLVAVVTSLQGILRGYDVVIRYGGDEFVCILCDQTEAAARSRFEQLISEFAATHRTRLSVGFAQARGDELPEGLIARADAVMIASREGRGGQYR